MCKMKKLKVSIFLTIISILLVGCTSSVPKEKTEENKKGYQLSITKAENDTAEEDGLTKMKEIMQSGLIDKQGEVVDKNSAQQTLKKIAELIAESGVLVLYNDGYDHLWNYKIADTFLKKSLDGEKGEMILYKVCNDGGLFRNRFYYDGKDMYLLSTRFLWDKEGAPLVGESTHTRIKKWKYTSKGWFMYELCVPEPPEVTELVDGNVMIRILPMKEEYLQFAKQYLLPISYKGNNLFTLEWNKEQLEALDYNALFEFFYELEYQTKLDYNKYKSGIPEIEFESLLTAYLPVTKEQLREYATFDEQTKTYLFQRLSVGNYFSGAFHRSIPEVVAINKNGDNSYTVTIDAVCEPLANDQVITHELNVKFNDHKIQYLGNHLLENGKDNIPDYKYRVK